MFILARPAAIILYHMFSLTMLTHKIVYYKLISRKQEKDIAKINATIEVEMAEKVKNSSPFEQVELQVEN